MNSQVSLPTSRKPTDRRVTPSKLSISSRAPHSSLPVGHAGERAAMGLYCHLLEGWNNATGGSQEKFRRLP